MTELSLGISPCPNDVFIFSGLLLGRVETDGLRFCTHFADVEELNRRARNAELDVAKISYANYIHCEREYELLSCGGALGRGCGPLLLTHGGPWSADREVLVPGQYTTANLLLDFYLQRPVRKRFVTFDALYEELLRVPGSQGVVIHEKRFTYERDGLMLVQDLGQHWEEQTGYPIPLGGIVLRRELSLRAPVEAAIRRSLEWAEAHRAEAVELCRRYAQDMDDVVIQAHIGLYVNDFSRNLGAEGQAAVEFFIGRQRENRP